MLFSQDRAKVHIKPFNGKFKAFIYSKERLLQEYPDPFNIIEGNCLWHGSVQQTRVRITLSRIPLSTLTASRNSSSFNSFLFNFKKWLYYLLFQLILTHGMRLIHSFFQGGVTVL